MPVWLQIIIAVVGALGTICGILGISAYITERQKHKAQKKNLEEDKQQAELEELKHQKYLNELRAIVKDENEKSVAPIQSKIEELDAKVTKIDGRLAKVEDGTLDALRDRILSAYYKCKEKGYRTQYDFENVHHMHKDYLALDGNSFVEDCMKKFDALPGEEEYIKTKKKRITTKKKGSQVLVENK